MTQEIFIAKNNQEASRSVFAHSSRIMDVSRPIKSDLKILFPNEKAIFSKDKFRRVITFARKHSAAIDDYTYQKRVLRVIDLTTQTDPIPHINVSKILEEQETVNLGGVYRNCILIAEDAVRKQLASGRLYSDHLTRRLIGWSNHALSYNYLSDKTVLGFDLTASANIDQFAGNFNTLALRTRTFTELKDALKELYGGDWHDYPIKNHLLSNSSKIA